METEKNIPCDSLSPNESKILLDTVDENCNIVENLALSIIGLQQIPLLNSMLCMDKDDFKLILYKCQESSNIVDKYLLLLLLTDFISCVCANNDTFPINRRKNEKKGIKLLLLQMENIWKDFFSEVTLEDMKSDQRESLISVVTRGLEKNKCTICGIFLENILKMSLKTVEVEKMRNSETPKSEKLENMTGDDSKKNKSKLFCKTPKTPKVKSAEITSDTNVRNCEKTSDGKWFLPMHSETRKRKITVVETTDIISRHCNKKCPLKLESPKRITNEISCNVKKKNSSPGNNCTRRNSKSNSCDITRFILKPCENNTATKVGEKRELNVPLVRKCGTSADTSEVTREPPRKKQCITDDFVNGKINALKCLMMSQKKSKENKTV